MHTKGKWKAEGWLIVKDVKTPRLRYAIAETNLCDGISGNEAKANAHLIAAAPDLLAACKLAVSCMNGYEEQKDWTHQIQEAIAKAEAK